MSDVTMPQLGETVTEGTITKWFKQVGDDVAADEPLFEVSTDKVDTEVPSPVAGTLTEIRVQEGETVDVGTKLAVIAPEGAAPAEEAPAPPEPATQEAAAEAAAPSSAEAEPPAPEAAAAPPPLPPPRIASPEAPYSMARIVARGSRSNSASATPGSWK